VKTLLSNGPPGTTSTNCSSLGAAAICPLITGAWHYILQSRDRQTIVARRSLVSSNQTSVSHEKRISKRNATSATSEAGIIYPTIAPPFIPVLFLVVFLNPSFSVFCESLFVCWLFFFWSLHCLSFKLSLSKRKKTYQVYHSFDRCNQ
jgi:hypothetical protein